MVIVPPPVLTDAAWVAVAGLLAGPPRRGKRCYTQRAVLAGILWVMHTGASWREVPPAFGPWHTVYDRYRHWHRDGTWLRLLAALEPPPPQDTS